MTRFVACLIVLLIAGCTAPPLGLVLRPDPLWPPPPPDPPIHHGYCAGPICYEVPT